MKTRLSDKVYLSTETERHQKEVKFVAAHDDDWIKTHLAGVFEKRGESAYNKLRNDVEKLWVK